MRFSDQPSRRPPPRLSALARNGHGDGRETPLTQLLLDKLTHAAEDSGRFLF